MLQNFHPGLPHMCTNLTYREVSSVKSCLTTNLSSLSILLPSYHQTCCTEGANSRKQNNIKTLKWKIKTHNTSFHLGLTSVHLAQAYSQNTQLSVVPNLGHHLSAPQLYPPLPSYSWKSLIGTSVIRIFT